MQQWKLITAAAVALAGVSLSAAAEQTTVQERTTYREAAEDDARLNVAVDPATTEGRDDDIATHRRTTESDLAPDAEGIRDTLASATEAAVKEGTFDDLVERFVDADRNRLGEVDLTNDRFNLASERFRNAWKARYDEEFEIENEELVFDQQSFMIRQHEIGGEARTAGERLGDALERTGERISDATDRAVDRLRGDDADAEVTVRTPAQRPAEADVHVRTDDATVEVDTDRTRLAGGDTNREPGREMAIVTIPPSHGLPQARIEMVREFPDSWKIDVPDHLDAATLHMNLQRELDRLVDHQSQWPADQAEAQRLIAHAVMLAIIDKDSQASGETAPAQ